MPEKIAYSGDVFRWGDWVLYSTLPVSKHAIPERYEAMGLITTEGVAQISDGWRPDQQPCWEPWTVIPWENLDEVVHVHHYDGMGYENVFEKYPPEGFQANRQRGRYEPIQRPGDSNQNQ